MTLKQPTSYQVHDVPSSTQQSGLLLFAFEDTCDPLNGECLNCKGRWLYRHVTDGDGRKSLVEDYFEVSEPCELHGG